MARDAAVVAILVTAMVVMVGVTAGLHSLILSPISRYQGIHPSFIAVYDDGQYYTDQESHEATTCRIGPATMNLDPDHEHKDRPNLLGELRDIQIVRDLSAYEPQDAYAHIVNKFAGDPQPDEPYKSYTWEAEDSEGLTHEYQMDLWLCSLEVNAWVKPDESEEWFGMVEMPGDEVTNNRWEDAEVWLRLEASHEWGQYFQDANISNTYFGLAYMEVAQVSGSFDADPGMDVYPSSKWMALDVYDQIGGQGQDPVKPGEKAYQWRDSLLNPSVFRDEWFTKVSLADFGVYGYNALTGAYNSDTVQFKILVHVFVVGEWVVKPELERDAEEHQPPEQPEAWEVWLRDLSKWLENPFNRLKFGVISTVLLVALILLFAPWIFIDLISGGRKVGKELGGG